MANLLEETLDEINLTGKTPDDIDFVNIPLDFDREEYSTSWTKVAYHTTDWNNFTEFCKDFEDYDNGYGTPEVPIDTVIVFKDGSWLERFEYDGSESWHYKRTPKKISTKEEESKSLKETT